MDSHIKHGCQRLKHLSLRDKNLTVKTSAKSRFEAVSYSVLCVTTKMGEIPSMVITYSSDEHRCPAHQIFCL